MPEWTTSPAANATAVTAMAIRPTTSSMARPPEEPLCLEAMVTVLANSGTPRKNHAATCPCKATSISQPRSFADQPGTASPRQDLTRQTGDSLDVAWPRPSAPLGPNKALRSFAASKPKRVHDEQQQAFRCIPVLDGGH